MVRVIPLPGLASLIVVSQYPGQAFDIVLDYPIDNQIDAIREGQRNDQSMLNLSTRSNSLSFFNFIVQLDSKFLSEVSFAVTRFPKSEQTWVV